MLFPFPIRAKRSRNAFTLIELLVVIAIIAILAAILFPVFARAREMARAASCLSNEKQLSLAVLMYDEDYDETKPPAFIRVGVQGGVPSNRPDVATQTWRPIVLPYVKNRQVFLCPSLAGTAQTDWGLLQDDGVVDIKSSYALDWYDGYGCYDTVFGSVAAGGAGPPSYECFTAWGGSQMKDAAIQTPAQMLMLCEVTRGFPNMYPDFIQMPLGPNFLGNIHNERANFAFQDGHVKSLKWTQTLGGVGTGWATFMWFPNTSPFIPYDGGQAGPPSPWLDGYRGNLLKLAPPGF